MKARQVVFLLVVVLVLAVAAQFFLGGRPKSLPVLKGLPWQIKVLPDGTSEVFGLHLGRSTLDDARRRFGPDPELALIARIGELGSLEAYYPDVSSGPFTGKVVLGLAVSEERLKQLREHAVDVEAMESGARKFILNRKDYDASFQLPLRTVTFLPFVRFDEEIILKRFGTPARRLKAPGSGEHFLYPDRGLDVALGRRGKAVLQYMAPRDFAVLMAPLEQAAQHPR